MPPKLQGTKMHQTFTHKALLLVNFGDLVIWWHIFHHSFLQQMQF
jgi:hypothetical protein